MTEISIASIIERDIDLLIIEELVASPRFLDWFVSQAGLPAGQALTYVAHSRTSASGENDIELGLEHSGVITCVLLEDKVDAPLQPRQAERYRERARRYVKEGFCARCLTGIIAPAKYLGEEARVLNFDFTVEYESLLAWFQNDPGYRDPRPMKLALLEKALDRGAAGWTLVPSERTTEFWRRYWELARTLAPELKMAQPFVKPESSGFVYFRPAVLPRGVKLIHKIPYGNVDIQFDGQASKLEHLTAKYGALLEPGMSIEKASKSAVIRVEVPKIEMFAPFLESEPAVREAIWAAKLLLVWYKSLPQHI